MGLNPTEDGNQEVEAEIPFKELYGYGTTLRSLTGGNGDYSYEFLKYQQAPHEVQEAEVEARKDLIGRDEV